MSTPIPVPVAMDAPRLEALKDARNAALYHGSEWMKRYGVGVLDELIREAEESLKRTRK